MLLCYQPERLSSSERNLCPNKKGSVVVGFCVVFLGLHFFLISPLLVWGLFVRICYPGVTEEQGDYKEIVRKCLAELGRREGGI